VLAARIAERLRADGLAEAQAALRAIAGAEAMLAAIAHWLGGGCVMPAGSVAEELAALAETASR
jgi:hypothetical protein